MECQSKKGDALTEVVGGKTIGSSVNLLTDMVMETQLKVGELDCEVTKVFPSISIYR